MSDLRKLAHLQEQLGDEKFTVLIDSGNTGKVKEFCDGLLNDAIPTEMTVGGRTYDLLGFLQGDEKSVVGHTMVERAVEMEANLGKEDGEHILEHQGDIPEELRGKVYFVFTDWRHPDDSDSVFFVYWGDDRWVRDWDWLDDRWFGNDRVLRRK